MNHETNKHRWRRLGDVDYVCLDVRPARKAENGLAATLEWLPAGTSGACEAFQSLQATVTSLKTPEKCAAFYEALKRFADEQRNNDA